MPMLEYDVRIIGIDDVELRKSITNPFDPLLIVRDPYNSRIIKSLHYIVKEICPRGNNKVVIYISLYHDKCLLLC